MNMQTVLEKAENIFVQRPPELRLFKTQLDNIRQGTVAPEHRILIFTGETHIGKTTLLKHFYRYAREEEIPCALIDFDSHGAEQLYDDVDDEKALIAIVSALYYQLSRDRQGTGSKTNAITIEEVVTLLNNLNKRSGNRPSVLIFDTMERCRPSLFKQLQDKLFAPLMPEALARRPPTHYKTVLVLASRTSLIWDSFELRQHTLEQPLKLFSEKETITQLGGEAALARQIYQLTFGLPGAAFWALNDIRERYPQEIELEHINLETDDFFQRQVLDFLFKTLREQQSQTKQVCVALIVVSPLRSFGYELLRFLFSHLYQDEQRTISRYTEKEKEKPSKFYLELAKDMERTTYAKWDFERRGFVLTPAVRSMLKQYMRRLLPKKYRKVHELAAEWYKDLLDQGLLVYIVERLYHLACLAQLQAKSNTTQQCLAELQDYVQKIDLSDKGAQDLLETIRRDLKKDHELQELLPGKKADIDQLCQSLPEK